jgi:phosphoesterase RecJ-like protein
MTNGEGIRVDSRDKRNGQPVSRLPEQLAVVSQRLSAGPEWLIVTHERPDGDAIGSALSMAQILTALGKKWTFVVEQSLPERFSYLALTSRAETVKEVCSQRFDHVVAVDCADTARFGYAQGCISDTATIVNIDHHPTNPRYGTVNFVDEQAAATCELIYHVAKFLKVDLTVDLAKSLYTGVLTDTGGFALPNTTRAVHQIAAELLASGVSPYDISEPALESRSINQIRLLQLGLANLTVSDSRKFAFMTITRDMFAQTDCTDDDTEGLVDYARSIDSVEIGMLFHETPNGRVKVSLRSKRVVDVSRIAQKFSGGGHVRAAGCTLDLTLSDAVEQIIKQVELALAEA